MDYVVNYLLKNHLTISTMESATGGEVASSITNIPGASEVLFFSAVTYSNEYKIRFGVPKEVIDKYTVYSKETARSMAKAISDYTGSTIGIGTTGKMNREDKANPYGENDILYASIYDSRIKKYKDIKLKMIYEERSKNKELVVESLSKGLKNMLY